MSEQAQRTWKTLTAKELLDANLPPLRWVVDELLPEGLSVLVAPPKFGKSWMSLQLAVAVASGEEFLNCPTRKGTVVYLALEDSERRLQNRLTYFVSDDKTPPENLHIVTQAARIGNGLEEEIKNFVERNPGTVLIIIDVLANVRPPSSRQDNAYYQEYSIMGRFKEIADRYKLSILVIHHTRKATDTSDPVNNISGTNGISGSCDTIFTIERESRNAPTSILNVTGRDVQPQEITIRRDPDDQHWYRANPIPQTTDPTLKRIIALLQMRPEGWEGTALEFLKTTGDSNPSVNDAKSFGRHVAKLQNKLFHEGINYENRRSSRGTLHKFSLMNQPERKEGDKSNGHEGDKGDIPRGV